MAAGLMIALALLVTAAPLWLGARYGIVAWVSPLHLLGYFTLAGFAAKVLAYHIDPSLAFYPRYVTGAGADLRGAVYLALFICMICAGYLLAARPAPRAPRVQAARALALGLRRRRALGLAAVAVAIGTAALIARARGVSLADADALASLNRAKQINVNAAGIGATLAGIKTLFIIPKCAFVLAFAHAVMRPSGAASVLAVALGGLLVAVAVVSGDRFELVDIAVYMAATLAVLGQRPRGWGLLCGLGAGLLALGLAAALMTQWRLGAGGAGLARQIIGSTYFLDINVAIMVTDQMRPEWLLWGQSYGWWLFGWVPRDIWPDKPAIDLGVYLKSVVLGQTGGGAFNVTGPGEAFINFGWAGVLVGLVLGALFRWAEAVVLHPAHGARWGLALLYPLLVYPLVQACLQSSFSAFVVGIGAQLPLLALMLAVFLRPPARAPWQGGRAYAV